MYKHVLCSLCHRLEGDSISTERLPDNKPQKSIKVLWYCSINDICTVIHKRKFFLSIYLSVCLCSGPQTHSTLEVHMQIHQQQLVLPKKIIPKYISSENGYFFFNLFMSYKLKPKWRIQTVFFNLL